MKIINRKAGALWEGDLQNGKGQISTESQVLYQQPYSFATRFEDKRGTNPEELIAAAHAACFSMAFADTLKKDGYAPERIDTNSICVMESQESGGFAIKKMHLNVRGQVPDINFETFEAIGHKADKGCPVSNLLRPGLEIEINFKLVEYAETTLN
jgi:osmotically inducible protein OsmC